ncbi:hypothetical protein BRADI_3g02281v3 [Brachypodium distachyon]|uniref:Uncharacterized protein n=1 Tax=Brachypodium distachyon TaxID=15368 RepID=A0A2K2CUR0_BRADI|nr:hypothetical protein BRADI_3g02281v3 [Brachypodium distachyon]
MGLQFFAEIYRQSGCLVLLKYQSWLCDRGAHVFVPDVRTFSLCLSKLFWFCLLGRVSFIYICSIAFIIYITNIRKEYVLGLKVIKLF